ncbi:MAG: threonine synthase, partial [Pseudomonadota bacterium]|nr:threonine synthase [Pseudomonadota bacterium]
MSNIKYISTRGDGNTLLFKDVIFEGLAPDGGLYIPEAWPVLDSELIKSFKNFSYNE